MITFIRALMVTIVALHTTTAQAEFITYSTHGEWSLVVWVNDEDENVQSCDLVSKSGSHELRLEYWSDNYIVLQLFMDGPSRKPIPTAIDMRLRIDNASPFTFENSRNYGSYVKFQSNANSTFWGTLVEELRTGNNLYFLANDGTRLQPPFSLSGTKAAISDWFRCIEIIS